MKILSLLAAVAATTAALLGLSAPSAAAPTTTSAVTVKVVLTEMKIAMSKKAVAKGTVSFSVVNKGQLRHDFKIAGKKTKMLAAGQSAKLTVKLAKAGRLRVLCTVPSHAAAGMKGTLVVR